MSLLARQMFNYESYFRGNLDSSNIFWFRFISVIKPRRIKVWSKTKEGKIFFTKKKTGNGVHTFFSWCVCSIFLCFHKKLVCS